MPNHQAIRTLASLYPGKSLEDIHFEQTGREVRKSLPTFSTPIVPNLGKRIFRALFPKRKPETLEEQIKRQALQIRADEFRAAKNFKVVRDARGNVTSIEIDHAEEARRKQFGDGIMSADEIEFFKREFAKRLES